jgi:hypothetical protein
MEVETVSITLVDANDIARWAGTRRAQGDLPVLVRRLVHATTTEACHIDFAAGDAVQMGGYDGVVVIEEEHHHVPKGLSVWELSVSKDTKGKADKDYEKRKAKLPHSSAGSVDAARTTYVAVTARSWGGKTGWLESRRAEGFWRDVRVIDAVDLEAWLGQARAVHVWFSLLLGKRPEGVDDVMNLWQDWSQGTQPSLSPGLLLAGRQDARAKILKWFEAPGSEPRGIESESPEEAVAFIAASLQSLPEDHMVALLARTIVAQDKNALERLSAFDKSLFIICTFPPGDLASRAARNGHKVLVAHGRGEGFQPANLLTVPRVNRRAAESELKAMGVSEYKARELATIARRSLLVLRRRLAAGAAVRRPAWASPESGPALLPLFLVGAARQTAANDVSSSSEQYSADIQALAHLANISSHDMVAHLSRWAAGTDPPVRRIGEIWYLISKEDAWEALSQFITPDLMQRFEDVALRALGSLDPAYELPPDERRLAKCLR